MGAALYGTVVGSLIGGWPTDRFGRRATLIWVGVLYIVSAIGCALRLERLLVHRRAHSSAASALVSRRSSRRCTSPRSRRRRIAGELAGMFQFNIVLGIVVAFASNALLRGIGEHAWRWMLGVAAIPVGDLHRDVLRAAGESAVAADAQR